MAVSTISRPRIVRNRKRFIIVPPGTVFGRLTVIDETAKMNGERALLVRCECGTVKPVLLGNIRAGRIKTCGCRWHVPKHGHWRSSTYSSWAKMTDRCLSSDPQSIKDYRNRGITIDPAWRQFERFLADMGERPPGMTLERIDNDGGYTKANCRWATRAEQMRNTRRNRFVVINGQRVCLKDASEILSLSWATIPDRARRKGITIQDATDFYVNRQLSAGVTSNQQP